MSLSCFQAWHCSKTIFWALFDPAFLYVWGWGGWELPKLVQSTTSISRQQQLQRQVGPILEVFGVKSGKGGDRQRMRSSLLLCRCLGRFGGVGRGEEKVYG